MQQMDALGWTLPRLRPLRLCSLLQGNPPGDANERQWPPILLGSGLLAVTGKGRFSPRCRDFRDKPEFLLGLLFTQTANVALTEMVTNQVNPGSKAGKGWRVGEGYPCREIVLRDRSVPDG
jgi:hypothetical protein